jgi:murein tripeptide amidase MpaA
MDSLAAVHSLPYRTYGNSPEGRPLKVLELSSAGRKKPVIVLLCRQHPPEVTGWSALQSFLAELLEHQELSQPFLRKYSVFVFPILNPDGVDRGFWRHNTGGVDLNRDWSLYNQPEIRQTVEYIIKSTKRQSVVLALDFHSTYHDIFYTNDESLQPSALPEFKDTWISALRSALPDLDFEERNSKPQTPVSKNWFYRYFNACAITYEIGDDTPEDIIALKGRTSAELMMRILLGK